MVARDFRGGGPDLSQVLVPGAIGGIIAGLIFAAFEMIMAAILQGAQAFFMPLRMIGGIVLGQQALDPTYPLINAALAGVLVHMVLAVIFGVIYAILAAWMPEMISSTGVAVVAGSIYGLLLWVINFYVIAPAFGWNWFPNNTNTVVQIFAHGLFFGVPLAIYLVRMNAPQKPVRQAVP